MSDRDERQARVREVVGDVTAGSSVSASFLPGRRETDLVGVVLTGEKEAVLAVPLDILEHLPEEDVEVISSGDSSDYTLELVITERLEAQEISTPERRSKLQNFLFQEMVGQKEER